MLSGLVGGKDGLVGGNPTMNTPRLRRGGGITPSSSLVLLALVLLYSIFCDSASELERWALLHFLGFSCPNLLLVFLNLLFLGTCYIFFRKCWDFLWASIFIYLFFVPYFVPYFGLACDHGIFFFCLEE